MLARRRLIAVITMVGCLASLSACTWPFGTNGPRDIRINSVTDVDFKNEGQLEWISLQPRPSIIIARIDFSTSTDLLALAREYDYNVVFAVGSCSKNKDGITEEAAPYGGVFWGKGRIYSETKDREVPGYADEATKGPPFTYQVYVEKLPSNPQRPLCFTLRGGNMLGGKLRSNVAVIPSHASKP